LQYLSKRDDVITVTVS